MNNNRWRLTIQAFWVLCFLPLASLAQDFADVDKRVQDAMKTFDVPGVAIAVVKDDKLIYSKGFGVKNKDKRGKDNQIDSKTLFGVASNTKAFTAAAIAMLVDEGKLNWDDKVVKHLPNFVLYDPYVTAHFTVADLLSHRGGLGLGAGDLLIWPTTDVSNDEIMARMRYIKPASSFRSKYAYNNIMFVVAGELVAKVSGMGWHDFVQKRILNPLSMQDTRMSFSRIESSISNIAKPHAPVEGKLQTVGGDFLENFSSAGSMASNVDDMSKWLRLQLRQGLLEGQKSEDGERLFSAKQHQHMTTPKTIQSIPDFFTEHYDTNFRAYGLGWGLNDYRGHMLVGHTGGILGMVSKVVLVPKQNLGLVILTNQQSGSAFNAMANDILDEVLGLEKRDWVDIFEKRLNENNKEAEQKLVKVADISKKSDKRPASLPLKDFAQVYNDPWYGDIEVALNKDKLEIQFSRTKALVGRLEHYQHNTFIARWNDRSFDADAFITFQLNEKGEVSAATMKAVSPKTDFSFDFHDLYLTPKS